MGKATLIRNIGQLITFEPIAKNKGLFPEKRYLGLIKDAAIVSRDGLFEWIGRDDELPDIYKSDIQTYNAEKRVVMPGFVDCHTHLVFAGNRSKEIELRMSGVSYQEIADKGGGINYTVAQTRKATDKELYQIARKRLNTMLKLGVTTVEIKSGYGLTVEDEIRILKVINTLRDEGPQRIIPTFMGAHTYPAEFKGSLKGTRDYLQLILDKMIPEVVGQELAEFCDIFIEKDYFNKVDAKMICEVARSMGLKIKLHVDEFEDGGGALFAAEQHAISAEHLIKVNEAGRVAMKKAGTVAVLLPGVSYFMGTHEYAPAKQIIKTGVPVAIATDFNPGTSPIINIQFIMNIAVTQMKLTPAEVFAGVTYNAAKAVSREKYIGSIEKGKLADCIILNSMDYNDIVYNIGVNQVKEVFIGGKKVV